MAYIYQLYYLILLNKIRWINDLSMVRAHVYFVLFFLIFIKLSSYITKQNVNENRSFDLVFSYWLNLHPTVSIS